LHGGFADDCHYLGLCAIFDSSFLFEEHESELIKNILVNDVILKSAFNRISKGGTALVFRLKDHGKTGGAQQL